MLDARLSTARLDAHLSSGGIAAAFGAPAEQVVAPQDTVPLALPVQTMTAFGSLATRADIAMASLSGAQNMQLQAHAAMAGAVSPFAHAVAPVQSGANQQISQGTPLTLRDLILDETKQQQQRQLTFHTSASSAVGAPKAKRKAPKGGTEGAASRVRLNTRPGTAPRARPNEAQETGGRHKSGAKFDARRERSLKPTARPDARVSGGKGSRLNKSSQDTGTVPAPRPPPPAREAACGPEPLAGPAGTGAAAAAPRAAASAPAAAPASQRGLVQVELCHAAKKKKLQLRASVSVGELIEQYGKVVKGEGDVILTDAQGLEHGRDITVGMLAEEARAAGGRFPLRLELRLDDW